MGGLGHGKADKVARALNHATQQQVDDITQLESEQWRHVSQSN
jgi:ribosomal protein S5